MYPLENVTEGQGHWVLCVATGILTIHRARRAFITDGIRAYQWGKHIFLVLLLKKHQHIWQKQGMDFYNNKRQSATISQKVHLPTSSIWDRLKLIWSSTFKTSSRIFQLQSSVAQQPPASDQVLFGKHLTTLHPHDGLTVSATNIHNTQDA